jgi:hypothetical protein
MASGFVVNDAEVTGIGTSYASGKVITLHEDTTADAKSLHGKLPGGGATWSHIDLVLDATSGSPTTVQAYLTWDSGGDDIAAGPTQNALNLVAGLTDTSLAMASLTLGTTPHAPASQTTAGTCYLFIKVDTGAVTLKKARLHWYTTSSRP